MSDYTSWLVSIAVFIVGMFLGFLISPWIPLVINTFFVFIYAWDMLSRAKEIKKSPCHFCDGTGVKSLTKADFRIEYLINESIRAYDVLDKLDRELLKIWMLIDDIVDEVQLKKGDKKIKELRLLPRHIDNVREFLTKSSMDYSESIKFLRTAFRYQAEDKMVEVKRLENDVRKKHELPEEIYQNELRSKGDR